MVRDAVPPSTDDLDFLAELGFRPEGGAAPRHGRRWSLRRRHLVPVVIGIFVLEGLGALGAVLFFHQRAGASLLQRTSTYQETPSGESGRLTGLPSDRKTSRSRPR